VSASSAGPAATAPGPADGRIAVIGMAGRFPGAPALEQYWADILAGVCRIGVLSRAELAAGGEPPTGSDQPGYVGASGRLTGIDQFDAEFFGMSPREAALTDPQQRLFLQTAYHALEDGGYAVTPPGTRVGVYAGTGMTLYSQQTYLLNNLRGHGSRDQVGELQVAIGNVADFVATRVAYRLGLTGPAAAVQTACSTSLVAVHLAVQALLAGDADMALAARQRSMCRSTSATATLRDRSCPPGAGAARSARTPTAPWAAMAWPPYSSSRWTGH
jgi:acyl transferase domain-containing protein